MDSYSWHYVIISVGRVAQSVQRLTTGWTVRNRIPVGTRFSARPDRPWDPPSLLYNGYQVFSGGRGGGGVGLTPHPHLMPKGPRKEQSYTSTHLKACVAYKKGENRVPSHVIHEHIFSGHLQTKGDNTGFANQTHRSIANVVPQHRKSWTRGKA